MEPFISEIRIFAGYYAPRHWAFCDGALVPLSQYTALFAIIGTLYGGDGKSTFALPDLRGRVPVQAGQGPGLSHFSLGHMAGNDSATLLLSNLPPHNHNLMGTPVASNAEGPTSEALFANAAGSRGQPGPAMYSADSPSTQLHSELLHPAGAGTSFSLMKPVLSLNYIIALQGIFPQRP